MIYKTDSGAYVISSHEVWLPGSYACERGARLAFRLPDERLRALQDVANDRAGGTGGDITYDDVLQAVRGMRAARKDGR